MSAQIQGKTLTPDDIGRQIRYRDPHGPTEIGLLSSYREDGAIFVRFKGPNGERCPPERLSWATIPEEQDAMEGRR
jgi:hypothetical protein